MALVIVVVEAKKCRELQLLQKSSAFAITWDEAVWVVRKLSGLMPSIPHGKLFDVRIALSAAL